MNKIKRGRPGVDIKRLETVNLLLKDGLNYSEIARLMGRSKQIVKYWAGLIHKHDLTKISKIK